MDTPAAVAHVRKPPKKREMTMPVAHNYRVASQEVTTKDVAGFVNTKNLTATQRKKQKYYQEIQKPMNELMKEIKDNAKKKSFDEPLRQSKNHNHNNQNLRLVINCAHLWKGSPKHTSGCGRRH